MTTKRIVVALAAGVLSFSCRADTVFLTNGSEVDGTVVELTATTVAVKRANGSIQSFRRGDVESIVYEKKKKVEEIAEPKKSVPTAPAIAPKATTETKPVDPKAATTEVKPETKPAAEVKPATTDEKADPKTATDPKATTDPKTASDTTKKDPAAAGKDDKTVTDAKPDPKKEAPGEKKDEWTAPPGLPSFPDHAKRMPKEKEEQFMAQLERMANIEPGVRSSARDAVAAMGPDVLPYVVAGIQHQNVEARSTCMALVGQLNGRTAVKHVIEVFFSAMPDRDAAPSYQVPFIRAIKETLPAISSQSFIAVQPDKALVQDGLKKYVDWYNDNFDRLPAQLGEPKIEPTDPDYAKKLKEARKLKLEKKSWPRPAMPADIVTGAKNPPASASERPADRALRDTIKTVKREDAGKR